MDELDSDCFAREFPEFEEAIPLVAKVIVARGIKFWIFEEGEDGGLMEKGPSDEEYEQVWLSIYSILKELVLCTSEMTTDELGNAIDSVIIGCQLVAMVNEGILEERNGEFVLTKEHCQAEK